MISSTKSNSFSILRTYKRRTIRYVKAKVITARHRALLRQKADLTNLKVAFVVLTESTWKLEPLLRLMEEDDTFKTAVIVTPMKTLDETERQIEQERTIKYFENRKGESNVLTTAHELAAFDPDIIFLTNPHRLSDPAFYNKLFEHRLCCYVPYTHGVDQVESNQGQYNQWFHNAMWRIFVPHEVAKQTYRSVSLRKDRNVLITGFPACEPLLEPALVDTGAWKKQDRKKLKVIWAPHHTIDMPELPFANFLRYADKFKSLSAHYQKKVQWAFKPHPLLKSKLYNHPDWGRHRTDNYFDYWKFSDYSQLEEGEYVDLFRGSDAMVHDSVSFLAEYLYLNKPVQFIQSVENVNDYLNDFGVEAFEACEHAHNFQDIEDFISALTRKTVFLSDKRAAFFRKNIQSYFLTSPSSKIIDHLKREFPKTCNVRVPLDTNS